MLCVLLSGKGYSSILLFGVNLVVVLDCKRLYYC